MAAIKRGGQLVRGGTFFNLKSWEFIPVPRPQGYLPGTEGQLYLRVPTVLVLVLGPVLGLFFVILLPLAGILAIPIALARGFYWLVRRLSRAMSLAATPATTRRGKGE